LGQAQTVNASRKPISGSTSPVLARTVDMLILGD
jgi:hypothetical protein